MREAISRSQGWQNVASAPLSAPPCSGSAVFSGEFAGCSNPTAATRRKVNNHEGLRQLTASPRGIFLPLSYHYCRGIALALLLSALLVAEVVHRHRLDHHRLPRRHMEEVRHHRLHPAVRPHQCPDLRGFDGGDPLGDFFPSCCRWRCGWRRRSEWGFRQRLSG